MYCKSCNSQLPDSAAFCTNCGAPVEAENFYETGILEQSFESSSQTNSQSQYGQKNAPVNNPSQAYVNTKTNIQTQQNNIQQSSSSSNSQNYGGYQNAVAKPEMKDCYIKFWENTTNYSDRARRSEYWYVVLMNFIISVVASITVIGAPLMVLYSFACMPQMISLIVRRLHDIGKEWYYLFFYLIPIAGPIIILVWMCQDSQPGTNEFGENPKGIN